VALEVVEVVVVNAMVEVMEMEIGYFVS